jgi:predicted nucleotidyltransferase
MVSTAALRSLVPESLAEQVRTLGRQHGISNIRVFGSFARGDAQPESDLDLLVEYVPGHGGFAFVDFCEEVERVLGRRVDVVTENSLHPLIRETVLRQAVPL